jgi:hypothetical protein
VTVNEVLDEHGGAALRLPVVDDPADAPHE